MGASSTKSLARMSMRRFRGVSVEIAGEWVLELMISGRFWNSQLQTGSPI